MLALLLVAVVAAACNGRAASTPTVTNLLTADEACGVDTVVTPTFNCGKPVDTLADAFTVTGGANPVEGVVADGTGNRTATFSYDDQALGTMYSATIVGMVASEDGVALDGDSSLSVTTVGVAGELAFAVPTDTEYPAIFGVSSIGAEGQFVIEFPAYVNAAGALTFELIQDDDSPDLLRSIDTYEFDPPWDPGNLIASATYGVTFDTGTGTISGRTPLPGAYTGTVLLTDRNGQTLEAPYEIVLAYTASYPDGETDIALAQGDDPAYLLRDRLTLVPGARVTIAGANPLAFGARPPRTPTLLKGTERLFELKRVGGTGADGLIEINDFNGTISVLPANVVQTVSVQTWVYDVVVTHTETVQTVTAETFTFTLPASAPSTE